MAGIEAALITSDDIAPLFPAVGTTVSGLPPTILEKIKYVKEALHQPYNIPHGRKVYITSDIHSDLEKLMFLFYRAGLIDTYYTTNPTESAQGNYVSNPLQVLDYISNFNIIYPGQFICILVGDIVDGARDEYSYIHDPVGNLEILLHIFLFNFRIKANILGSELRFTIGNHDWGTVVNKNINPYMYLHYVTDSSKLYFNSSFNLGRASQVYDIFPPYNPEIENDILISWTNRRACLLPFYEACPFLVVTIDNEVICVHGGLFRKGIPSSGEPGIVNMSEPLIEIQKKIDTNKSLDSISDADNVFLSDGVQRISPLWTRFYQSVDRSSACTKTEFKMTVIGHCPTDRVPVRGYHRELIQEARYAGCDAGGCVLVGCESGDGPGLALVDITMSRAFNPLDSNNSRRADLLYLDHESTGPTTRFYNSIYRVNVGASSPSDIIKIYPMQALPVAQGFPNNINLYSGGKRSKRTRTKKSRRKNKLTKKYKKN